MARGRVPNSAATVVRTESAVNHGNRRWCKSPSSVARSAFGCSPNAAPQTSVAPARAPAARASVGIDLKRGHLKARVRTAIPVQADQHSARIHHDDLPALNENLRYGAGLDTGMESGIQGAVLQNPHETIEDQENPAIAQRNGAREADGASRQGLQGVEQFGNLNSLAVPVEKHHLVRRSVFEAPDPDEHRPVRKGRVQVGEAERYQFRRQARLRETESPVEASVGVQAQQPSEALAAHKSHLAHQGDSAVPLNRYVSNIGQGRNGGMETGVHAAARKQTDEPVGAHFPPPDQDLAVGLYGKPPAARERSLRNLEVRSVAAVRADTADPSVVGQNQIAVRRHRRAVAKGRALAEALGKAASSRERVIPTERRVRLAVRKEADQSGAEEHQLPIRLDEHAVNRAPHSGMFRRIPATQVKNGANHSPADQDGNRQGNSRIGNPDAAVLAPNARHVAPDAVEHQAGCHYKNRQYSIACALETRVAGRVEVYGPRPHGSQNRKRREPRKPFLVQEPVKHCESASLSIPCDCFSFCAPPGMPAPAPARRSAAGPLPIRRRATGPPRWARASRRCTLSRSLQ